MVKMTLAHNVDSVNRTQDVKITEDITFDSMLLNINTLEGLKKSGFYYPSPIQLLGVPLGKCGFDLLLEAKSGTGKTAVFTIIALEKLDIKNGLQSIILAPTREIAAQICDVVNQIGSGYKGLNVEVVIGGLSVEEDMKKFNSKVHVLVASPGRLKHLIQMNVIDISAVRLLVIDEADKLMEKSFLADINYIFGVLPAQKQVILSSATYPEDCKQFLNSYVKNFHHICPESNCVLKGVIQKVVVVKSNSNIVRQTQYRFNELLKILSKKQFKQCLIFCNYQVRVTELHRMLMKEQWPVELLYGKQEQIDRLDALKTLQEYKCRILISTDLAARGIDASNVDLVINFEPPFEWQTYLHRIGRAGRFGSYGTAITILSEGKEVLKFKNILQGMKESISLVDVWTDEPFELHSNDNTTGNDCSSEELLKLNIQEDKTKSNIKSVLWNVLTSEKSQSVNNPKDIASFDHLLNSYNNYKDESIQSFQDLLKSFDSIQENFDEDNSIYKTIKADNDLHIVDFLCDICSMTADKSAITKGSNYKEKAAISNNINGISKSELKSCSDVPLHNNNNYTEIASSKINNLEWKYENCNKSLLDLDLPISFASKKRSDKKIYTNNNDVKPNSHELPQSHQSLGKSKHMQKDVNCIIEEKSSTATDYSHRKTKDVRAIYGRNESKSTHIKDENEYVLWYNQFKCHIKSIELGFYLNEMSKY